MGKLAKGPCESCPYRKDVPSGVWHREEYEKLPAYDRPTAEQPFAEFHCHAVPENLCFGWAVCHSQRGHENELLALRIRPLSEELPASPVPLFSSGAAACKHGKKMIDRPKKSAVKAVEKLSRKYLRLRSGGEG